MHRDDVKLVNCAQCGCELLGESMHGIVNPSECGRPFVGGRINGRPYCNDCLRVPTLRGWYSGPQDEDWDPWQQNAVRQLEDG